MFKHKWWLLLVVGCALTVSSTVHSQTSTGTVLGTLRDPSQAVLPGAEVVVRNVDTGIERQVVSDGVGNYTAPLLPPGSYEITATLPGFSQAVRTGIELHVDDRLRVDFQMEVGAVGTAVTVQGDASLVQSDSATLGALIDRQKIVELPLNGRDFFQLTYLVPGATEGVEGSQNTTQGGAVAVNGMREQSNRFLLDGVSNTSQGIGQVVVPPPIDSIREFKVQSGLYNAEFGTGAGAQLNFVTRSGTNDFHGSVYEFHRNAVLDAKNFFDIADQGIPKFIRNQYGASIGGPIARERTFFFANFEGLRERKAITRLATVPESAFINGDFSSLPFPLLNPATGEPFPGNIIPSSAMDPIGSVLAGLYPAPNINRTGANFVSHPVKKTDVDQFVVRLDHQWGPRHSFFGRYAFSDEDRLNAFDPLIDPTNLPGFGSFTGNRGQNAALGWTYAPGPNLLGDFRIGYNRIHASIEHESQGKTLGFTIPGVSTLDRDIGFPGVVVVGYDSLLEAFNTPQASRNNTYEASGNLSWVAGRHLFKFGGNLQHRRGSGFLDVFARGQFVHTGAVTRHPVADLLLGRPTLGLSGVGDTSTGMRGWSYSLYVQDSFRVSDRLSLEWGLRYEYHQPPFDRNDGLNIPDLTAAVPTSINCGTQGIPRGCMNDDKNNFAPRLGFAYMPFDTRTVVRGGYGIFYDAGITNYNVMSSLNRPRLAVDLFFFQPISNPFPEGAGLADPQYFFASTQFRQAYAQQWSLNIQQELDRGFFVEVGYVGTKGTKLLRATNLNQPQPGGPRPFPAYGAFNYFEPTASSIYHGLQVRAERRIASGFSFLAAYTLSKSIDDASSLFGSQAGGGFGGYPQDSQNHSAERALSDFDSRHNLVLNYVWDVPWGDGPILGGWQTTGIVNLRSSRPFTPVLAAIDNSGTGNGAGQGVDRPNLIGNPHLSDPDPDRWFNTDAFEIPVGTFGSAGRNILRGPGHHSVDFAMMKSWSLGETSRVQFRTEFFNLFNHPNFNLPNGDFTSSSFGQVTSAKDSRQIQFGLRLEF